MTEWWDSVFFSDKWVFWFLLAVPLYAVGVFLLSGRRRPALKLSSLRFIGKTQTPGKVKWLPVLHVFRVLAFILFITALARPQSHAGWRRQHGEGIDIMLAIDVSPSMQATDFLPTRMEAAKNEAMSFIDNRPDDRIGVVIFSAEAFTLCPLTTDHEALKNMIAEADPSQLEMGTAIGMGLANAVDRLKDSKAKSKVVILLTDGENNSGVITPLDAGRLAKTFHIRVYTIGLGAQGDVLTPTTQNPDGSFVQQYVASDIDESTLMQIAQMTGGKYFRAGDNRKLDRIYSEINRLEKTEFEKKETEQRSEEFLPFLLAGLFFILLEFMFRYTVFDTLT